MAITSTRTRRVAASLASVFALLAAGAAQAGAPGSCGGIGNCDAGTVYQGSHPADYGPTTVRSGTPYDFLDSVRFSRAPHVSITRIHGMGPTVGLADAPVGFTDGCHPTSTAYCRDHNPVAQPLMQPVMAPQPVFRPAPAPVMMAPAVPQERIVAIGGGYDPSKFAPRIYGDLSITPGIAHVPTSIVDRNPYSAQAVLDRVAPGSVTPALSGVPIRGGVQQPVMPRPVMQAPVLRAPMMPAPVMQAPLMRAPVVQPQRLGQAGAPIAQGDGTYASTVGTDGTYWEKVSGPQLMGSTVATSVICKRKLPTQTVNPTVGVPYPVPVAVPGPVVDACHPTLAPFEARYPH